jgi:hypothetical protein
MATLRKTQPLRVTATGFATHVVEVHDFSKLRKKHRGDTGYVCSETFTVDGLDWMIYCHPGGVGDEQGYMAAFLELVTEGVAVWAHFSLGLVDWATGCAADAFLSNEDPVLFDAGNDDCCNWGTDKLASWRKDLRGSRRYLRRDCLRIECVIDICHFRLAFRDPPAPKFTPRDVAAIGTFRLGGGRRRAHTRRRGRPHPRP